MKTHIISTLCVCYFAWWKCYENNFNPKQTSFIFICKLNWRPRQCRWWLVQSQLAWRCGKLLSSKRDLLISSSHYVSRVQEFFTTSQKTLNKFSFYFLALETWIPQQRCSLSLIFVVVVYKGEARIYAISSQCITITIIVFWAAVVVVENEEKVKKKLKTRCGLWEFLWRR